MQQNLFNKGRVFANQESSWATPPEVFRPINEAFGGFTLDVCANADNAKCSNFIPPERDCLEASWQNSQCWMNPPYGKGIEYFLAKANKEVEKGMEVRAYAHPSNWTRVVCLLSDNVEAPWFRDYCDRWPYMVYPGRIRFIHPDGTRGDRPANGNIIVAMGYDLEELPRIEFHTRKTGRITPPWKVDYWPKQKG